MSDTERAGPLRFCLECDWSDYYEGYYCPECSAPFFPSAEPGSSLRPDE